MLEAAAGLHAAHETADEDGTPLGIVHRDVSPSNILLTRNGRVKVIDFGIAKARGRLGETKSGANLKGKLRYMPPEQAWGRPIDRRADVYSLGVVLWELLCRRPLFKAADDLAVLELVRDPHVPPPRDLNPAVPIALEAVVLRALAKDLDRRIQNAEALRAELMRAVPEAITISSDVLGALVTKVRETLGVSEAEDRRSTNPSNRPPSPTPLPTEVLPELSIDTSVGGAAGQVGLLGARRGRSWLALGGAITLVIATLVVVKLAGGDGKDDTSTVAPAPAPDEAAATPEPAAAAPAPAIVPADAALHATVATPDAAPAHPTNKTAHGPRPRGVAADGVILADPNTSHHPPPSKRPKSKAIEVDGTLLSE